MGRGLVILCHPRTGSNWLHDMLASHKDIKGDNEVCHPGHYRNLSKEARTAKKIVYIMNGLTSTEEIYMFKYFYQHRDPVIDEFLKFAKFKFIFLYRNPLDTFISTKLVEDNALMWEGPYEVQNIKIDVQELLRFLDRVNDYIVDATTIFSGIEYIEVYYEQLLYNPTKICNKILKFIQIGKQELKAVITKQRTKSFHDIIENAGEVLDFLKNSRYINVGEDYYDF